MASAPGEGAAPPRPGQDPEPLFPPHQPYPPEADEVDEASEQSFPASDAPSTWGHDDAA